MTSEFLVKNKRFFSIAISIKTFAVTTSTYLKDSTLNDPQDWQPPRLPETIDFTGKLTYIDDEGQFYVQPDYELAEAVAKLLTDKFDKKKCSAKSMYFQPGDLVGTSKFY